MLNAEGGVLNLLFRALLNRPSDVEIAMSPVDTVLYVDNQQPQL